MLQLINVDTTKNYKLLLWLILIKCHTCTSCQLRNYGSRTIASEENCLQTLSLTLTEILTRTGGRFSSRAIVQTLEITWHFVLCSLLSHWNYFWNKYCNLPFLAIRRSKFSLLIFLAPFWFPCKIKKKWLIILLKDFVKQSFKEQSI